MWDTVSAEFSECAIFRGGKCEDIVEKSSAASYLTRQRRHQNYAKEKGSFSCSHLKYRSAVKWVTQKRSSKMRK